jgi:hypothetical protein
MTDPEVGRLTFVTVIGRDPTPEEMAALMTRRLVHLPEAELREAGADYVLASLREPLPGLAAATVSRATMAGFADP